MDSKKVASKVEEEGEATKGRSTEQQPLGRKETRRKSRRNEATWWGKIREEHRRAQEGAPEL